MNKNMVWIMALMMAMLSCKGRQNEANAQVADALYAETQSQQAEQKKARNEKIRGEKAKLVRMYEIPAPLRDRPEQILYRKGYTTSYNSKSKTPNWVAWHLTERHTRGTARRNMQVFTEDSDVIGQRATNNDYYNSRYDRGHMCPAGDNKWDEEAMRQTFLFTNICPQNHGLNKYEWNDLEILCREWAQQYGAIDIVCGPIFSEKGQQKTIGKNQVWVPDAFFKVILCRQGKEKAIGFIYRNEGKKQLMEDAVRTVDEIEKLTQMDFFPELDDATEVRVEAQANLSDW